MTFWPLTSILSVRRDYHTLFHKFDLSYTLYYILNYMCSNKMSCFLERNWGISQPMRHFLVLDFKLWSIFAVERGILPFVTVLPYFEPWQLEESFLYNPYRLDVEDPLVLEVVLVDLTSNLKIWKKVRISIITNV